MSKSSGKVGLHCQPFHGIIDTKYKNTAGSTRCSNTCKACIGECPTYTPADIGRTAWILYDRSVFFVKAQFVLYPCPVLLKIFLLLCRLCTCTVFLFSPNIQGPKLLGVGAYTIRKNYTRYDVRDVYSHHRIFKEVIL